MGKSFDDKKGNFMKLIIYSQLIPNKSFLMLINIADFGNINLYFGKLLPAWTFLTDFDN
jgi:hypothetical protein